MSSSACRPGSSPATTSCSSCTSSQSSTPASTGSIRSPDSRFASSIESQQTNAARSSTTLSSSRRRGSFAPTAQTSAPGSQPLAAQDRVARGRDRHDHVLRGRVAVALAGLGADLAAELGEATPRAAVGDDGLDPRQRLADRRHLAARLPAAADHAQRRGALAREVLRRHAARRAGAQLAELVRLDHGDVLRASRSRTGARRSARPRGRPRRSSARRARARGRPPTSPRGSRPPSESAAAARSRSRRRRAGGSRPRPPRRRRPGVSSSATSASVR